MFRISHRIVGKHEEGGRGIGQAERFSTDICLIFTALIEGREPFVRRASLIQAKRLHRRDFVYYYPVDTLQLQEIVEQTSAGFLLLVGPTFGGVAMPVIPARMFLDLVKRGEPSNQIAPEMAGRLGKGISNWLVGDVIGLWTGDWAEDVLARAEGSEARRPFLLVEVSAELLPTAH